MNKVNIITVKTKNSLTPVMENDWKNYIKELDDPRAIFQQFDVFFQNEILIDRVNSVIALMIYSGDQLIGLLTFIEQKVNTKINFGLVKLLSTVVNEIRCIGSGIVNDNDNKDEIIDITSNILNNLAKEYDAQIFLEAIEDRDLLYNVKPLQLKSIQLTKSETFIAQLESNFEAFLKAKTKSKRQSINKDLKKFEKTYSERFSIKHNNNNFIDDAKHILNNSWKKGLVGSIVGSANFDKQFILYQKNNLVQTFVLMVDDEPIAFAIGYNIGLHFFYEEIAYDERFSRSGAGSYLTISVVKYMHSINETSNKKYFSFGVGDNIYKRKLYSMKYACEDRVLVSFMSKNYAFIMLKYAINKCFRGFRAALLKLGIHQYIRQKLKQRSIKG